MLHVANAKLVKQADGTHLSRDGTFMLRLHPVEMGHQLRPTDWRLIEPLARAGFEFAHRGPGKAEAYLVEWYRSRQEQAVGSDHERAREGAGGPGDVEGQGEGGSLRVVEGGRARPAA